MNTPHIGIAWPASGTLAPTVITYSIADERHESYLTGLHPDYPAMQAGLTPEQEQAFEQALAAWEQVAGVDFIQVGDSPWVDLRVGTASIDGAAGILALTGLWNSGSTTTRSVIAFDVADSAPPAATLPDQGYQAFYRTALHELGHVLGLGHSSSADDLMYPYTNATAAIGDGNRESLQLLYGAPRTVPETTVSLADNQELIQKCYIAYYGRPADPGGLQYWTDQLERTGDLSTVLNSFASAPESQALYGNLTATEMVTTIYGQLFGRAPEAEGLHYWTTQLEAGNLTRQNIMLTLFEHAQGTDAVVVDNKLTAATLFTNSPGNGYGIKGADIQDIRTWLAGITTDEPYQEAVSAAISAIGLDLATTSLFDLA